MDESISGKLTAHDEEIGHLVSVCENHGQQLLLARRMHELSTDSTLYHRLALVGLAVVTLFNTYMVLR